MKFSAVGPLPAARMLVPLLCTASLSLALSGCGWLVASETEREPPRGTPQPVFEPIPTTFVHRWEGERSHPFLAAAAIDVDGDGRSEVFVGGGEGQPDVLLRYQDGALVELDAGHGLSALPATYGATSLDLDGDGDVDLVVARNDGVTLYLNDGRGVFTGRKLDVPLPEDAVAMAVAIGDYDRDGDADLYLSVFVRFEHFRSAVFNEPAHAKRNVLLRNEGNLRFVDATTPEAAGLQNTFTSAFADLDGDGWPDLLLAQNTGQVELLRNRGDGTFAPSTLETGFGFWMGLAVGDVDNDGDPDLFFSNIGNSIPVSLTKGDLDEPRQRHHADWLLLRNDGGFRFTDVTQAYGLTGLGFAWGALFEDLNLDGRLDLLVAQNYIKWPIHKLFALEGKLLLQAAGPEGAAGLYATGQAPNPHFGQSPLLADLDGDGLPELLWANMNGPLLAYHNRTPGRFLTVVLPDSARSLGAVVTVERAGPPLPTRRFVPGQGLMGDPAPAFTFGLGEGTAVDRVRVRWADGTQTVVENPALGQPLHIRF